MEILNQFLAKITDLIPTAIALVIVIILIWATRFGLNKRFSGLSGRRFRVQTITMTLSFIGLLIIILTLPVSESTIGQLLGLLGILLSAAIALSATTFVGNIMAGFMLRLIKNFRSGDFVRIGDHFGRVSERGLFHIEIQTEDRDLTTLPNLYLVTKPVKVIRSSGTLVAADVSLGYENPRVEIEKILKKAGEETGLKEPFVLIKELGDFSITYKLAGILTDVKSLISTRSNLRAKMMDCLHKAGIEIVSPTFMNQRALHENKTFIPKVYQAQVSETKQEERPESIVFDKADEAESLENLRERQEKMRKDIESLKSSISEAPDDASRDEIKQQIEKTEVRLKQLTNYIQQREDNQE